MDNVTVAIAAHENNIILSIEKENNDSCIFVQFSH